MIFLFLNKTFYWESQEIFFYGKIWKITIFHILLLKNYFLSVNVLLPFPIWTTESTCLLQKPSGPGDFASELAKKIGAAPVGKPPSPVAADDSEEDDLERSERKGK